MTHQSLRIDVLVVGAGTAGLTLGAELLRRGVRCRIIDSVREPPAQARASMLHPRTMETLDTMGLAPRVLERARAVHGLNVYSDGRRVMHLGFEELESPYPRMYGIPQRELEGILLDHVRSLGGTVERGVTLESLFTDEQGVSAVLRAGDGNRESVRALYVVGCDGTSSTTRALMGGAWIEHGPTERMAQADVVVSWPQRLDDDEAVIYASGSTVLAAFPLFDEGVYRLIVNVPLEPEPEPTLAWFQSLVDAVAPTGTRLTDPRWMTTFRVTRGAVDRMQSGRVMLAGDAAHTFSPAGAQGLNNGLHDAWNLAWKLALVVSHRSNPRLLESYHAERHPQAMATLQSSEAFHRAMQTVLKARHPMSTHSRDALIGFLSAFDVVQDKAAQAHPALAAQYRSSPIVGQYRAQIWETSLVGRPSSEDPSLIDWISFGSAPTPGDRVVDVPLAPANRVTQLLGMLRETSHTLLMFDGAAATEEGYRNLELIGRHVQEEYGDVVRAVLIVPYDHLPDAVRWQGSVILDPEGTLHQRYGARSECLYLVRPDGHIGWRSQPASLVPLQHFLREMFNSPAGG